MLNSQGVRETEHFLYQGNVFDTELFGVFTAATHWNKPETPNTGRLGRIGLYSALALVSVLLALCVCVLLNFRRQAASEEGSDSGTGNSSAGRSMETL